jgi:hypothetical protein
MPLSNERKSMLAVPSMSSIVPPSSRGGRYTCVGNAEMFRVATARNLDAWYAAFDVKPGDKL